MHWRSTRSQFPRLTIASQFYPPDFAATGQLLQDLTLRLAAKGLQVQVLTGQPAYAFSTSHAERLEFHPNHCIRRTRVSRLWPQRIRGRAVNGFLFCLRIFLRMLRYSRRGDLLIYTTEPPYLPVVGWLLNRLTRTPYVLLLYDLYPDVLEELKIVPRTHALVRIWRQLNRWAYGSAEALIVLSEPMAQRLRSQMPEIAERIEVIPSWADPDTIRPLAKERNPFVLQHDLAGKFVVLYSGNQGRCHDLVTLMVTALLLRQEPDLLFLFIGGGPQNQRLHNLVADWGLSNCRFLPYQELETLPFSLTCADLAVVSLGIEAEGLVAPSKLYGHLAAGTPIAAITPSGSALQHLVSHSGCGRWFANGDAEDLARWIRELKANPNTARACGDAARQLLLCSASPELVVSRYMDVLERHLPEKKSLVTPPESSACGLD